MANEDKGIVKWNDDRPRQVYKLALLGATDKQIADILGVNSSTFEGWKRDRPDFLEALNAGKMEADAEVAEALFKRATGFTRKEKLAFLYKGEIIEHEIEKYYHPDSWAAARWLALRQRANWTEVQKIETTQTNINITKIDLTGFTDDQLKVMREVGIKQLAENVGKS